MVNGDEARGDVLGRAVVEHAARVEQVDLIKECEHLHTRGNALGGKAKGSFGGKGEARVE